MLAENQNIIVVSVQYRLGAFGFVHSEAFEAEDGVKGNWGIHDQRAALQWVNRYISHLGGDPDQVTISGCSAGGQSTMVHLTSPKSWPYFSKVFSFSAPNGMPYKTQAEAADFNRIFFRNVGCCQNLSCATPDLDCLRTKSVTEIQKAAWSLRQMIPDVCLKYTSWKSLIM